MDQKKHFVLVHGSGQGAWCWYKLSNLLKLSGHCVTALDLGASGINSKRFHEIETVFDYVAPLMEFMASLETDQEDQRVVLVAHSYAGLCISLAMENFPHKISLAVFLTAYMPHYNSPPAILIQKFFKSIESESVLDSQITFEEDKPVSVIFGPEYLRTKLYPLCPQEDLELAKTLVRPSWLFVEDFSKENMLSEANFGSVKRVYIACEKDQVLKIEFQRWMIENNQPEKVMFIKEADHMVMISKPNQLCHYLLQLAEK